MAALMAPQRGAGDGPEGVLPLREPSRTASRTWHVALRVPASQEHGCVLKVIYTQLIPSLPRDRICAAFKLKN